MKLTVTVWQELMPQMRLPLPCAPSQRRLLIVTNNSGVLLLATGDDEEPSLYQWGEDEELLSRYVTAIAADEAHVIIGVHGGIHFASVEDLELRRHRRDLRRRERGIR